MTDRTVSVIVAIYNVSKYLDRCIFSICEQTYPDLQIMLVNDGSSDDSLEKCLDWEKKDPRIEVIDKRNGGVSSARNRGIEAAKGKWICFVDGDDYLENDAVEKMVDQIKDASVLLADYKVDGRKGTRDESFLSCDDRVFSAESEKLELIKNCFVRTPLAQPHTITLIGVPWAKLYRTDLIRENGLLFDENVRKMQDAIFNLEVFKRSDSISYRHGLHVYHYVQNEQSITHKASPQYREIVDEFLNSFRMKTDEYRLDDMQAVYDAKKFMLTLSCIKFIYLLDKGKYTLKERISGTRTLLEDMDLNGRNDAEIQKYLGKAQKIAFRLYRMKAYGMIYFMSDLYLAYQNTRG